MELKKTARLCAEDVRGCSQETPLGPGALLLSEPVQDPVDPSSQAVTRWGRQDVITAGPVGSRGVAAGLISIVRLCPAVEDWG